ncbi:MAG: hypothetical protein ACI9R3_005210 [Verrucomicrobiales bacterium]
MRLRVSQAVMAHCAGSSFNDCKRIQIVTTGNRSKVTGNRKLVTDSDERIEL